MTEPWRTLVTPDSEPALEQRIVDAVRLIREHYYDRATSPIELRVDDPEHLAEARHLAALIEDACRTYLLRINRCDTIAVSRRSSDTLAGK